LGATVTVCLPAFAAELAGDAAGEVVEAEVGVEAVVAGAEVDVAGVKGARTTLGEWLLQPVNSMAVATANAVGPIHRRCFLVPSCSGISILSR
jgi:hypothetical protein